MVEKVRRHLGVSGSEEKVAFTDPFFCLNADGVFNQHLADIERSILGDAQLRLGKWDASTGRFDTSTEALAELSSGADVLVVYRAKVGAELFEQLDSVRLIVRQGDGVDNIDLDCARSRGIPVVNIPDYCVTEAATHALALMLAYERGLLEQDTLIRVGGWGPIATAVPRRMESLTLGVLGVGRVGRATIARARPFFGRIVAHDPGVHDDQIVAYGAEATSLEGLLAAADYISLHADLNMTSRGMVNREFLGRCRPGAVLVNVGRGALVDERAVMNALLGRRLRGYVADVFDEEPMPKDSAFRKLPRSMFMGTCHRGYLSADSVTSLRTRVGELVAEFLATGIAPTYGRQ